LDEDGNPVSVKIIEPVILEEEEDEDEEKEEKKEKVEKPEERPEDE